MGIYIYTYIYVNTICLSVCVCVCLYLNAGLTAARINLIFGMHTLIWSDCAIGYIILTFEVIKGHFRSNKFLWQVPFSSPFRSTSGVAAQVLNTLMNCITIFM